MVSESSISGKTRPGVFLAKAFKSMFPELSKLETGRPDFDSSKAKPGERDRDKG